MQEDKLQAIGKEVFGKEYVGRRGTWAVYVSALDRSRDSARAIL